MCLALRLELIFLMLCHVIAVAFSASVAEPCIFIAIKKPWSPPLCIWS